MSLADRYLLRLFAGHFAVVLGGAAAFVVLFDLLLNADEIVTADAAGATALLRYAALRLPEIVSQITPLAALVATLLALLKLMRHSELVALMGAGVSQARLMRALVPAALVVGGLQLALDDQAVPAAVRALDAWGVADYAPRFRGGPTWARDGDHVVRARRVPTEDRLEGVTIFERAADGSLVGRIDAERARFADGAWALEGVTTLDAAGGAVTREAAGSWSGRLRPWLLFALAKHPRELSLAEVARFVADPAVGNRPLYFYRTWLNQKIAAPLTPVLMIVLAVALVAGARVRESAAPKLAIGVAVALFYLLLEQLALAGGEAGLLPPAVAAWAPTLAFASVAGAFAFHAERP